MSITKTVFTSTTIEASLAEIAAWLTENAAVIGATVTTDESGNALLTNAGGTNFLKFSPNNATKVGAAITLDNGVTRAFTAGNAFPNAWSSGYVCADGLALCARSSGSHMWTFIGKTEGGGLCVVQQEYASGICIYYADIGSGVRIVSSGSTSSPSDIYFFTNGDEIARTSFAPVCFDSGEAAATMFFTPQTQYLPKSVSAGLEMVISDGGEEFVYSGVVAMRG